MFSKLRYTIPLLLALIVAGCTGERFPDAAPSRAESGEELPVEFICELPSPLTRGFDEDAEVKTAFKPGDVIHVLATFDTEELQVDGSVREGTTKRYGILQYNGKGWDAVAPRLTWPSVAVKGRFEAYYISGSDGALTEATESETYLLSGITPAGDPMHALSGTEGERDIVYGHAVRMRFEHLCAYLTLVDLEPQVATEYWMTRNDVPTFNNAFRLSLSKDADGLPDSFNFEFCRMEPDPDNFPGLIYIDAKTLTRFIGEKSITRADYFLEPGLYDTFSISYKAGQQSTYDYLQYDYNKIPGNIRGEANTPPKLEAGVTYTLTITKSSGITITSPPSAEGWDETGGYVDVDVEDFLRSIYDEKDYFYGDVQILEKTATGTKLLRNVDFHFADYSEFSDEYFAPNIMEDSVFDGDYHYIKNLGCPLFRYNYGTIKNLGIHDVKIDATSYEVEYADGDNARRPLYESDMSRHGALCMWNRTAATISNVRVGKVEMNISVRSEITADTDGSEAHNIGCLTGSNTGIVNGVSLSGAFQLHVGGVEGKPVNASVLIGGISGQNAAGGSITDVSPLEGDLAITIRYDCKGDFGSYSVGGVVGESSGSIAGVILSDVTVDGTGSSGVTSYVGGIAGQLDASTASTASSSRLDACIISGSLTPGETHKYGEITSGSYIGSIAGADLDVPVLDCRTAVSVIGPVSPNEGVIYATGGAFGRIRSATTHVEDCITYGSALSGPDNREKMWYIGNFAGIVYKGQTWEEYAAKNNLIRTFGTYGPVGAALDSNNSE